MVVTVEHDHGGDEDADHTGPQPAQARREPFSRESRGQLPRGWAARSELRRRLLASRPAIGLVSRRTRQTRRPSWRTRIRSAMPRTSGSSDEIIRTADALGHRLVKHRPTSALVPTSILASARRRSAHSGGGRATCQHDLLLVCRPEGGSGVRMTAELQLQASCPIGQGGARPIPDEAAPAKAPKDARATL